MDGFDPRTSFGYAEARGNVSEVVVGAARKRPSGCGIVD
jgi:hypothetical protein